MIIKTLVENTSISDAYKCEHGLSLYIETKNHKLLFDLGQSDLFIENSKKLNINLTAVDTVVISHGHYDHGGGLRAFLSINSKAKVYIHKRAFDKHYSLRAKDAFAYIGLDQKLRNNERLILTSEHLKIDDELELISNIIGNELTSVSNKSLFKEDGNTMIEDSFDHEQSLIITEAENVILIAGCAHKGIVNIVRHATSLKEKSMDFVIGGFHLYNSSRKISETPELINKIATCLDKTGSKYYTCHCTGLEAYSTLKVIMNKSIQYLATGSIIHI